MSERTLSAQRRALARLADVLQLIVAATLIFVLSYVLGRRILNGPLPGNDSALHLGYTVWLNQYFPEIPDWYPLQGGGVSLLHGYPILPHLTVVILHRFTGLSLLQGFRLISFLAFPLSAIGIHLFCWSALRRQSIGLLAAIFFLLAPVTWTWLYDWGFFAQQLGLVFLPLSLLAYDRTLKHSLGPKPDGRRRLWFVATVIAMLLGGLMHMLIGVAAATGALLYTVALAILRPRRERAVVFWRGFRILVLLGVVLGLIAAAYWVPFYRYSQEANRTGSNTPAAHQLHRLPIAEFFGVRPIDPLEILTRMQFPLVVSLFALLGALLAWLNARREKVRSREGLALSLACLAAMAYTLIPALVAFTLRTSPLLFTFLNFRSLLLLVMVLYPCIASYGVVSLAALVVGEDVGADTQAADQQMKRHGWSAIRSGLVPLLSFGIAAVGIFPMSSVFYSQNWNFPYGPLPNGLDLHDLWDQRDDDPCLISAVSTPLCGVQQARSKLNISEFYQACASGRDQAAGLPELCGSSSPSPTMVDTFVKQCSRGGYGTEALCEAVIQSPLQQLIDLRKWPEILISNREPLIAQSQRMAGLLSVAPGTRLDVSPYHGRLAQDLTVYSNTSQLNSYTFQVSLIHEMWGYQQGVFYSRDEGVSEYGNPRTLNEAAKWFGTEFVFLEPDLDPVETYLSAGWERVFSEGTIGIWSNENEPNYLFASLQGETAQAISQEGWGVQEQVRPIELWRFPESEGLLTATSRPAILVIGKHEANSYSTIFRLANDGLIPYEDALLVDGGPTLDVYDLVSLKPFSSLLLYGHDYSDSETAWALLGDYVKAGGSLFVDTGWEYWIPEWSFEQAPSVLPLERISWTDYGMAQDYVLGFPEASGTVKVDQFKPLAWEGQAWTVSGAEMQDVREWGNVVLSAAGRPLVVAGQYGAGRVVWSGMNLIAHALYLGNNPEELQLLHNLIAWLTGPAGQGEDYSTVLQREHPDRAQVTIQSPSSQSLWLYWREAHYQDWHASVLGDDSRRDLPVYKAGPGFMIVPISSETANPTVLFRWEPSLAEKTAIIPSVIGLGLLLALTLDGLLLNGTGLTWLKIAVLTRTPKPFLGEGSNKEWAERKRRELTEGELAPGPRIYQPSEAIPWMRTEAEIAPEASGPANSNGQDPDVPETIEEHEKLLESWLAETGHSEDAWAERLLGKRPTSRET